MYSYAQSRISTICGLASGSPTQSRWKWLPAILQCLVVLLSVTNYSWRHAKSSPEDYVLDGSSSGLERRAASRTEVARAKMVLGCLDGACVQEIAANCQTRANTVIKWRNRFVEQGLPGLQDELRSGAQRVYGDDFRRRVRATLEQPPPAGHAVWDGRAVAKAVGGSVHAVWRVLRQEGICLQRQRSWCISTDKEFAAKAADIVACI